MAFKPGDTVRVKSGGPIMTVEEVEDHDRVFCTWMDTIKKAGSVSHRKQGDHFAVVTLEAVQKGMGAIGFEF